MRTPRPILLASAAAAVLVAAACSGDGASPAGPTIAGAPTPSPFFTAAPDTTDRDSVAPGYGNEPCKYVEMEYEPDTGTEYVVCPDTADVDPRRPLRLLPTTDGPSSLSAPTTGSTSRDSSRTGSTGSTSGGSGGSTTPQDSVVGGYGSGSTGGIEYDRFDYDPDTGTETVVTPDTTPSRPGDPERVS